MTRHRILLKNDSWSRSSLRLRNLECSVQCTKNHVNGPDTYVSTVWKLKELKTPTNYECPCNKDYFFNFKYCAYDLGTQIPNSIIYTKQAISDFMKAFTKLRCKGEQASVFTRVHKVCISIFENILQPRQVSESPLLRRIRTY